MVLSRFVRRSPVMVIRPCIFQIQICMKARAELGKLNNGVRSIYLLMCDVVKNV